MLRTLTLTAALLGALVHAAAAIAADSCLLFANGQYAEAAAEVVTVRGAFTIEMWVYDLSDGGGIHEFASQGAQPGPFYLGTLSGKLRAGDAWGATGVTMPRGRWVHLALARTAAGAGTIYLDGAVAATIASFGFNATGTPFRLGRQFGSNQEYFAGCLDEVKIWRVARTAAQVAGDMMRGDAATDPDLVAIYDFEDLGNRNYVNQARGRTGFPLRLALPAQWAAIDAVAPMPGIGGGGLSNCVDGSCGAYFPGGVSIPDGHGAGFSWYSTVWPLITEPMDNFQTGLGSTWINSDLHQLEADKSPLLPYLCANSPFTAADIAGRGYNIWVLFQSIEGGLGYWADTAYRSPVPKYRIGATSNCYASWLNSPGWGAPNRQPLDKTKTGFAQLSNRLLIPPDGLTFPLSTNGQLLGSAWMALPFPVVGVDPQAAGTGANAWTLFLNTTNFKGPIAYFLPQFWSDLSQTDRRIAGLGLDANGGRITSMAAEWGAIPLAQGKDTTGTVYTRIPKLRFPVDANGRTILSQDLRAWSAAGFATPFANWLAGQAPGISPFNPAGGAAIPINVGSPALFYQLGRAIPALSQSLQLASFDGGNAYGLQWTSAATAAQFPNYFKAGSTTMQPVAEADVPRATGLPDLSFKSGASDTITFPGPSPDWWGATDPAIPGGSVILSDGSTVQYKWYRFVDQPALQRLNLGAADRQALQAMVERMHQSWPITAEYMPAPSSGTLATFDPALLVTPPAGLEKGYVPVVVGQTGKLNGPGFSGPATGIPGATTVFEFYNTDLRHFFRTAEAAEATAIDNGAAGQGWQRTGFDFVGYTAGAGPGNDVCRFYNPVANTHFYTADAAECTQVKKPDSGWRYEGLSFRIQVPAGGACPAGTVPVLRNYNNRFASNDSNHRFTTSTVVYNQMSAQGWLGEGTVMCAVP